MAERLDGRNGAIWRGYLAGRTQEDLAEEHGISQQRVSEILGAIRASIPELVKEDLFQRELDFLDDLRARAMELVDSPLPPLFHPRTGTIQVDQHGNLIQDESGRLAAMSMAVKLHERVARMAGLDAPVKADLTVTEAAQESARKRAAEATARLMAEDGGQP